MVLINSTLVLRGSSQVSAQAAEWWAASSNEGCVRAAAL
jgi:hypothetical protein